METLRGDEALRKALESDTRSALAQDPELLADGEDGAGEEGDLEEVGLPLEDSVGLEGSPMPALPGMNGNGNGHGHGRGVLEPV